MSDNDLKKINVFDYTVHPLVVAEFSIGQVEMVCRLKSSEPSLHMLNRKKDVVVSRTAGSNVSLHDLVKLPVN